MPPHHGSHHFRPFSHRTHSGRGANFYLYEDPCAAVNNSDDCPTDGTCCKVLNNTGSLDAAGNPKPNTLERRSPLPAGHYWFDAFGLNIPKADAWLRIPGVHVDATEHFPSEDIASVRTWYLFTYSPIAGVPVIWDTSLGYPTVASASVKNSGDTVSGADLPLSPLDELSNWMNATEQKLGGSIGTIAQFVPYAILGGFGVAGYLLLKEFGVLGKVKSHVRSKRRVRK